MSDKSEVKRFMFEVECAPSELDRVLEKLQSLLDDKEFQKNIAKAIQGEFSKLVALDSKSKLGGSPAVLPEKSGEKMVAGTQKAFIQQVTRELKNSSQGKRLKKGLKQLEEEFNNSPTGIWVDRNKYVVYIVGAIAIVGGTYAIYKSREDKLGKPLEAIDIKKKIGSFTLQGEVIKFQPGSGDFKGKLGFGQKLEYVKYDFSMVGAINKAGEIESAVEGKVVIGLNQRFDLIVKGGANQSRTKLPEKRGVTRRPQTHPMFADQVKLNAAVGVKYDGDKVDFLAMAYTKGISVYNTGPAGKQVYGVKTEAKIKVDNRVFNGSVVVGAGAEKGKEGLGGSATAALELNF